MEKPYISSTDVSEIIPQEMCIGKEALIALCKDKNRARRVYNQLETAINNLEAAGGRMEGPAGLAKREIAKVAKEGLDDIIDDCEFEVMSVRSWATESYGKMWDYVPIMTGHMRDAIRIMGTGPDNIDVGIDPDLIEKVERRPNIVPYYTGSAPFSRRLKVGGLDYSGIVNTTARPRHWWKGGTIPYIGFKTYWEINIKQTIAQKYKISYEVNLEEEI